MKKRLSTLAALAVGATCLFAPSAAAQAAEANQCWTDVATGESHCFTTFAAVIEDLSGGAVEVSGDAASFGAADAGALREVTTLASVPAGTVYEDANYGGASNTFVVPSACDASADVDFQVGLAGTAWDNRISSFKGFNSCQTTLWTNTYSGSSYGPTTNSLNVGGTLNDRASSIQWS
jgi:hypothetical protein